jgi:DNA-binding MarR family transcriptional regulator
VTKDEHLGELVLGLMAVGQVAAGAVDVALAEAQIPASVAGVLWVLKTSDVPPTMRDIATRLHCDPSTISLTADKLEHLGLIRRRNHPTDRRKRILVTTSKGTETWRALNIKLQNASVISALDAHQQRTLLDLLSLIRTATL